MRRPWSLKPSERDLLQEAAPAPPSAVLVRNVPPGTDSVGSSSLGKAKMLPQQFQPELCSVKPAFSVQDDLEDFINLQLHKLKLVENGGAPVVRITLPFADDDSALVVVSTNPA